MEKRILWVGGEEGEYSNSRECLSLLLSASRALSQCYMTKPAGRRLAFMAHGLHCSPGVQHGKMECQLRNINESYISVILNLTVPNGPYI